METLTLMNSPIYVTLSIRILMKKMSKPCLDNLIKIKLEVFLMMNSIKFYNEEFLKFILNINLYIYYIVESSKFSHILLNLFISYLLVFIFFYYLFHFSI